MNAKQLQHDRANVDPISRRHRRYGADLTAVDLDFLLYKGEQPIALFEYKLGLDRALPPGERRSTYAVSNLATLAGIPFFLVKYDAETWTFKVESSNAPGRGLVPRDLLSEAEWIDFLYSLRGERPPAEVYGGVL